MNARTSGSGPIWFGLILALHGGCAPEEPVGVSSGLRTIDIPYGEPALVVVVNARPDSTTTRSIEAPGASVADVYVEAQNGASAYTDASGIAVLSGIDAGFTTLTLEGDGETGTVGVQVNETGLTEVAISLRSDGAHPIAQVDWRGEAVETLEPSATGGVEVTTLGEESTGRVFVLSEESFGTDLEIRADNVVIYGEGFLRSWPMLTGAVRVYGRNVQLRGVWVEGPLEVNGPQFSMTFGGVGEDVTVAGGSATFLDTFFCRSFKATGDSLLVARGEVFPDESLCAE
jgi:hypothetical protein